MEKEMMNRIGEKNYDIAISNRQGVVMDNEITRSTPGFTGLVPPRESASECKTYPNLTMGRTHRSVRLDVLIAAPQNLEMANA
tara:strand:+ start:376 stop:624 length:249 start_codon:yes stop_codon:yes gene_type:complete